MSLTILVASSIMHYFIINSFQLATACSISVPITAELDKCAWTRSSKCSQQQGGEFNNQQRHSVFIKHNQLLPWIITTQILSSKWQNTSTFGLCQGLYCFQIVIPQILEDKKTRTGNNGRIHFFFRIETHQTINLINQYSY